MSKPNYQIPKVIDSQVVFQESLITIIRDTLKLKNGESYPYYTLKTPPFAVVILAMTNKSQYILNEEYRYPIKKFLWSCPGGFLNENEHPLDGAKRELLEETGYLAETFEIIGEAYPYAGISSQKTYYIRALNATRVSEQKLDASETIQTTLKSKEELFKLISKEDIDANLCTALFFNGKF